MKASTISAQRKGQSGMKAPCARVPSSDGYNSTLVFPGQIDKRLAALRRRERLTAIGEGLCRMLAAVSVLLFLQAVADRWFNLPWLARAGFLAADISVLGILYWRYLDRPLRVRKSFSEVALMIEKKWPVLRQCLISTVEFAEGKKNATHGSLQLIHVVFRHAVAQTSRIDFNQVVPLRCLYRWMALGGSLALGCAILAYATRPASVVLLQRIVLMNVPLPTRTIVLPLTHDMTIPVGKDVEVSVRVQGEIPPRGRLIVTYEGESPREFAVTPKATQKDLFALTVQNVQKNFHYHFHVNDGESPTYSVKAKVPPSLVSVELVQVFPEYTNLPPQKRMPSNLSLLAGSRLKVHAVAAEPLQAATLVVQGLSQPIRMTLDDSRTRLDAEIPILSKDLTGFSIHCVDSLGVASSNDTRYPITLIPDKPPTIKILRPTSERETITPSAKPVLTFEAGDDYGLSRITLRYEMIPPSIAGQENDATQEVRSISIPAHKSDGNREYNFVFDEAVRNPPWKEGWTVSYWIEAEDNNSVTGPGVFKTDRRQFSILSTAEKQAEILNRFQQNAEAIQDLSNAQQKVSTQVGDSIPQK